MVPLDEAVIQELANYKLFLAEQESAERQITNNAVAGMLALERQIDREILRLQCISRNVEQGNYSLGEHSQELDDLQRRAEVVREKIEAKRRVYFIKWQDAIRKGSFDRRHLIEEMESCLNPNKIEDENDHGDLYDDADAFVDYLLGIPKLFRRPEARLPEGMRRYQPSAVLSIYEMIQKAPVTEKDVLYDLGSGLGRVPMLVNLLTDAKTEGVEYFNGYHQYAQNCAEALGLTKVHFILNDAAEVDYSDATVFFLFNSFGGKILEKVGKKMERVAQEKPITLCTVYMPELDKKMLWLRKVHYDGRRGGLTIYKNR